MPPKPLGPRRLQLARRLEQIAAEADLQASELGAAIGRNRSSVFRLQRGETLPRRRLVLDYLDACRVTDPAVRADVLDALEAATTEVRSWGSQARDGSVQHLVADALAGARLVCAFQPVRIPGLLQTPAYAQRLLDALADGSDGVDAVTTVADRLGNQSVLDEPGRTFRYVIGERVLSRDLGSATVMAAQRDRLSELGARDRVQVLILPEREIVPEIPFTIYDQPVGGAEPVVAIELPHGPADAFGEHVQVYRDLFSRLRRAAYPLD